MVLRADEYPILLVPPIKDVLAKDEERPVLYDSRNLPLRRPVGFRCR